MTAPPAPCTLCPSSAFPSCATEPSQPLRAAPGSTQEHSPTTDGRFTGLDSGCGSHGQARPAFPLGGYVPGTVVPKLGCLQAPPTVIQALLSRPVFSSYRRAAQLGPRRERCSLPTQCLPHTHQLPGEGPTFFSASSSEPPSQPDCVGSCAQEDPGRPLILELTLRGLGLPGWGSEAQAPHSSPTPETPGPVSTCGPACPTPQGPTECPWEALRCFFGGYKVPRGHGAGGHCFSVGQ